MPPSYRNEWLRPSRSSVDRDRDAGVQERELAQPLRERLEAEVRGLEDVAVGLERDLGAALLRLARDVQLAHRRAALVALLVDQTVAPDLQLEPLRQRVDDGDADAVQSARNLVRGILELAAGMEHRQHDFRGGLAALVHVHGNAAPVVDDRDRAVDVDSDVDVAAIARQGLVDGVVDDLVDEVVQPARPGRADVHRRPLADGLEPFENFDFVGAVVFDARRNGARRGCSPAGLAFCL